jgi:hypothetical protein
VLDVSHDPSHLNPTLQREVTANLHLPSSPRATPGADLSKPGINDHLVQVNETTEIGEVPQRLGRGESGEIELEVGARGDVNGLEDAFCLNPINDLKVCRVISGNGATRIALLQDIRSDTRGDIGEVMKPIHTAIEISPDGFDLRDTEEEGVHQTKDVEGHLFGRERPDVVRLELLGDQASSAHQTSTTGPPG